MQYIQTYYQLTFVEKMPKRAPVFRDRLEHRGVVAGVLLLVHVLSVEQEVGFVRLQNLRRRRGGDVKAWGDTLNVCKFVHPELVQFPVRGGGGGGERGRE